MEARGLRPGKTVSLHLPIDVIEKVDRLAEMADISRSKLLANMVEVAADELLALDKIGVLRISLLLRDLSDRVRERVTGISMRTVA